MSSVGKTRARSDAPPARKVERPSTAAVCQSPQDAYSIASRRTIRTVLRTWLHKAELTPVELLHHPDHLRKLEDSGTILQSAVQRAAMAQTKQGSEKLHDRQRVLYGLFDEIHRSAKLLWRDSDRPQLSSPDAEGIAALDSQVSSHENSSFLFNAAIAEWLSDASTLGAKLSRLAAMIAAAPAGSARQRLEEFALDFFEDGAALSEFLRVDDEPGIIVIRIGEFMNAARRDWFSSDRTLCDFHKLLSSGAAPVCRSALFERLIQILENPRSICSSHAYLELHLIGRLRTLLADSVDDDNDNVRLEEAFAQRSSRQLSSFKIEEYLADCASVGQRLRQLLHIEPGVVGPRNKKVLADRMLELLLTRESAAELARSGGAPAVRLRELAELQQRIKDTSLPPSAKTQMMEVLDRISLHLAKQDKFFDFLTSRLESQVDAAIVLMRLCAANTFTQGATLNAARQRASRMLQSPTFMQEYFGDTDDAQQRQERLQSLATYIIDAGLPNSPVSAALIKASAELRAAAGCATQVAAASPPPRPAEDKPSQNRTGAGSNRDTTDGSSGRAGAAEAESVRADSELVMS